MWRAKWRARPPGETWHDVRHAEAMATYLASQGVKGVKPGEYQRFKVSDGR